MVPFRKFLVWLKQNLDASFNTSTGKREYRHFWSIKTQTSSRLLKIILTPVEHFHTLNSVKMVKNRNASFIYPPTPLPPLLLRPTILCKLGEVVMCNYNPIAFSIATISTIQAVACQQKLPMETSATTRQKKRGG